MDRPESAVLRRPADGSRVPAHVCAGIARTQGDGGPLDAAGADVGCRASAPCRPRVLPLAEHGALLRSDLAQTLDVLVCVDLLALPVTGGGILGAVVHFEQLDEERSVMAD